jgi:hypothetical protein
VSNDSVSHHTVWMAVMLLVVHEHHRGVKRVLEHLPGVYHLYEKVAVGDAFAQSVTLPDIVLRIVPILKVRNGNFIQNAIFN